MVSTDSGDDWALGGRGVMNTFLAAGSIDFVAPNAAASASGTLDAHAPSHPSI
jgi:hypothetical protein